MIRILVVVACLTGSLTLAQSVPGSITFNARLTDSVGAPVVGSHPLGFGLYSQASGGSPVWTENISAASFSTEGVAFAELGAVTPLTVAALDGSKLYLEVAVDGTTMTPRLAIVSVPYAIRAAVAGSVGSLSEAAIQRRVTGICSPGQAVRAVDAAGGVQCEATGVTYGVLAPLALNGTTLSLNGCPNNQILKSNGTTWSCADDAAGLAGITTAAGSGLTGGGSTGTLPLALAPCTNGQVLKSNGTTWSCADGIASITTVAGSGLTGGGSIGTLPLTLATCTTGQVLKFGASGWACAADNSVDTATPVLSFPFNEGRGQFAFDFSGRKIDGTLGQTTAVEAEDPTWVPDGVSGSALSFNGVNNCVRVPDAPELNFGDGVTVMAWMKRTGSIGPAAGAGMLVAKHYTNNSRAWDIEVTSSTNQFVFDVIEDVTNTTHVLTSPSTVVATLNTWFHVAGTYDRLSGTETLYINGVAVSTAVAGSFPIQQTTVPTRIGCYNLSPAGDQSRAFFTGVIDEVLVFNRALSAEKVAAYFRATP